MRDRKKAVYVIIFQKRRGQRCQNSGIRDINLIN